MLLGAALELGFSPEAEGFIAETLEHEYFGPARAALGEDHWARAQQAGAEMTYEDALALAVAGRGCGADDSRATPGTRDYVS